MYLLECPGVLLNFHTRPTPKTPCYSIQRSYSTRCARQRDTQCDVQCDVQRVKQDRNQKRTLLLWSLSTRHATQCATQHVMCNATHDGNQKHNDVTGISHATHNAIRAKQCRTRHATHNNTQRAMQSVTETRNTIR
jgi:hypothetical protein